MSDGIAKFIGVILGMKRNIA